jgi:hypothetical protein
MAVVEWLTLFNCIQRVPGSNLGLETGNPGSFSRFFLSLSK